MYILLSNCSNTSNIRLYRFLWKYVKTHEISTDLIFHMMFFFTNIAILCFSPYEKMPQNKLCMKHNDYLSPFFPF